jgi:hypothetical protein
MPAGGSRGDRLPARSPTKLDIELIRLNRRYDIGELVARGAVVLVWLLAVAVIVHFSEGVVHDLSGKKTEVDVNILLEASVAISVVVNLGQYYKSRNQRNEMLRERQRADDLEDRLLGGSDK